MTLIGTSDWGWRKRAGTEKYASSSSEDNASSATNATTPTLLEQKGLNQQRGPDLTRKDAHPAAGPITPAPALAPDPEKSQN